MRGQKVECQMLTNLSPSWKNELAVTKNEVTVDLKTLSNKKLGLKRPTAKWKKSVTVYFNLTYIFCKSS